MGNIIEELTKYLAIEIKLEAIRLYLEPPENIDDSVQRDISQIKLKLATQKYLTKNSKKIINEIMEETK